MSSSPMSSLNGYYEGLGGNVTALPMDASFDDYNREGLQPQLAKSSEKLLPGHRRDQAATTSSASVRSGLCCITPSLKWALARTA